MMRSSYKKEKMRMVLVAAFSMLTFLIFFILSVYLTLGYYLFTFSLDATFATTSNIPKNVNIEMPKPLQQKDWFDQIDKEDVYITSFDGYRLHAYEFKQNTNSDKWAVCVHGYRDKAEGMSLYAYNYYNQGFNVLLPDLKGHGKSEGKYVGMGYTDRKDLLCWIEKIINKFPTSQIVLHGVSMGAATVMMTCGEDLPSNVKVAVEDCGYSSVYDQYAYVADNFINIPLRGFALGALNTYAQLKTGVNLKQMDATAQLQKSKVPMLFIHGDKDTFVPLEMLTKVYDANSQIEKEKFIVAGATHAYSASQDPENYFNKVFEFIGRFIT